MTIQSRLLAVDFYNCKGEKCSDESTLRAKVSEALAAIDLVPIQIVSDVRENGHISLMALLPDGHLALHAHPDLRHVSLDIYLCAEDAALDPIANTMRRAFQPDKTKSTHLRRGDFRAPTEIRPKTTTRVAPIRRIKTTGAKVIRILARRTRR